MFKKDLFKWRSVWNNEGRAIRVDELTGANGDAKKDDNSVATPRTSQRQESARRILEGQRPQLLDYAIRLHLM
jgi:hypothetical protein